MYDYKQNISSDYLGKMSVDFEQIEEEENSLYKVDMNKECELCFAVDKPIQSQDLGVFTPSLNFKAQGECCLHYKTEEKEEKNLCIKDN